MLSTKSIKFYIALKTAPWLAAFLIAAGLTIAYIEHTIFYNQLDAQHESRIARFAENKQRVLDGFLGQVSTIASNELVVNGLIDMENSEAYLSALINSYSLVGTNINSVKIVDYKGATIISNHIEVSDVPTEEISIFDDVINTFVSDYKYLPKGVVFLAPIWLGTYAEGAVVVEVPYGDLKDLYSIDIFGGEIIYASADNKIFYASNESLANQFIENKNSDYSVSNQYKNWYVQSKLMPNGRTVYSFESKSLLFDKLYWFVLLGIASLVIACAGALISVVLSSSIISKTLGTLLDILRKGKINRHYLKTNIKDDKAPDELIQIYQNFNLLLKDLKRSETFGNDIQSIINSLSESLVVFDMEGNVILSNHSFKKFTNDVLGDVKAFDKIIPKPLQDQALSTAQTMKDFECVYSVLSDFKKGLELSKKEKVVRWSRSLYLTQENTIGGLTFIGVDITEQKKIENDIKDKNKKIEDLSQRFNLALEAAVIGVWEFNAESSSLIWDDRMHEIYQVPKNEFTGTINDWIACVHPLDFENTHQKLQESVATGEDLLVEFRIVWPNDEVRWISANARVSNEEGALRVVGANIDITETKRLNQQLEEALKKAEDLVKIKSDFLASMSHEIRTPMNGVLGMLRLLQQTNLNHQQSRYTDLAHSSADSLLLLINDILDFSKIDAGKLEIECIDFNLPDLLGDITESLAQRAQEKGLEVILDIADIDIDIVNGDPGRVRQIFTNLIGNAIKFTDKGEITIAASVDKSDDEQLLFNASVIDTGIGIPENKIDTLFESFSQVDASTTRKYGGTGLGLAIVKQLCHLMGGNISIKPNTFSGSQFDFYLRFNCSEEKSDGVEINQKNNSTLDLHDKFIVTIDDNFANTTALYKQLSAWQAKVLVLNTISDAFSCLGQEELPDLLLIDADMPEMKGLDFVNTLRAEERFDNIKIVLMTNVSQTITADDIEPFHSTTILIKPVTRKDFISCFTQDMPSKQLNSVPLNNHLSTTQSTNITLEKEESESSTVNKRILLVEDNLINQEVAQGILASFDLSADIAENGLEALKILKEKVYDIVLMDCQMPEMDGYEATRSIRSGKTLHSNVPIVAMTANAMKGDREKCLAAGMNDYLSKPINPQQLIEKIEEWSTTVADPQLNEENVMDSITDNYENAIIWDREDFMNRIMNNETLAHKLLDLFKVDTPKTINELNEAVEAGEASQAGLLAHKLKGTVSNLGGVDLAELAYQIEQAGKEDDLNSVKELWPMVRPKFDKLLAHIEQGL